MTNSVRSAVAESLPQATVGFMHDRVAPLEWTERLAQFSPPSEVHSFLSLVWEPGELYFPWQRWTLYQTLHPRLASSHVLAELRGPHPRSSGHMCADSVPEQFQCLCRTKWNAWRGGPCSIISLSQWKFFQRTGLVGQPWWIIQGETGGHRISFSHDEGLMLEHVGLSAETPEIGSLPYAPFDERVLAAIPRFNRLWILGNNLETYRKIMGPGYRRYKANMDQEMRAQFVREVEDDTRDVADLFISAAAKGQMDGQRKTETDFERLDDLSTESYVETGQFVSECAVAHAPIVVPVG